MNPSRRSQPYRMGSPARVPGPSLDAMLKGAPMFLPNPIDVARRMQREQRRRKPPTLADLLMRL